MPCLDCGIPTGKSRCPTCETNRQEEKELFAPRVRASSSKRGYDHDWRTLRVKILARDKMVCHYCQRKMTTANATVDHVIALSNGGERLSESNLVSACRSCNSRKKDR